MKYQKAVVVAVVVTAFILTSIVSQALASEQTQNFRSVQQTQVIDAGVPAFVTVSAMQNNTTKTASISSTSKGMPNFPTMPNFEPMPDFPTMPDFEPMPDFEAIPENSEGNQIGEQNPEGNNNEENAEEAIDNEENAEETEDQAVEEEAQDGATEEDAYGQEEAAKTDEGIINEQLEAEFEDFMAEYDEKVAEADAEYIKIVDPAWDQYIAEMDAIRNMPRSEEYYAIYNAASDRYDAIIDAAAAQREARREAARAEYEEATNGFTGQDYEPNNDVINNDPIQEDADYNDNEQGTENGDAQGPVEENETNETEYVNLDIDKIKNGSDPYADISLGVNPYFSEPTGNRVDKVVESANRPLDLHDLQQIYLERAGGEISMEKWRKEIGRGTNIEGISIDELNKTENGNEYILDYSFMGQFGGAVSTPDSFVGSLIRSYAKKRGFEYEPIVYGPETKEFFNRTNMFKDELSAIEGTYNLLTQRVRYTQDKNNWDKLISSEEMLKTGEGVCRDQAVLLYSALKQRGVNCEYLTPEVVDKKTGKSGGHAWVRVHTSDGLVFDLDPTWYKDFYPLTPRDLKLKATKKGKN